MGLSGYLGGTVHCTVQIDEIRETIAEMLIRQIWNDGQHAAAPKSYDYAVPEKILDSDGQNGTIDTVNTGATFATDHYEVTLAYGDGSFEQAGWPETTASTTTITRVSDTNFAGKTGTYYYKTLIPGNQSYSDPKAYIERSVDFTGKNTLTFDYELYGVENYHTIEVWIDGVKVWSPAGTEVAGTTYQGSVDVSGYTGEHILKIGMDFTATGTPSSDRGAYFDNLQLDGTLIPYDDADGTVVTNSLASSGSAFWFYPEGTSIDSATFEYSADGGAWTAFTPNSEVTLSWTTSLKIRITLSGSQTLTGYCFLFL